MFENLYDNCGQKMKGVAVGFFVLETIGAIIGAFALMDAELYLAGVLALFIGPFVAWITSLFIYCFGELVEKTTSNEKNTKELLKRTKPEAVPVREKVTDSPFSVKTAENSCKKDEKNAPYWCGKCGHDGPYTGNCPACGSSMKVYNIK